MTAPSQGIFVACTPTAVFIRVIGRGACRNSVCLQEYGAKRLQEGYRTVVVDLRQCESMDSTFLGVFAGFGLTLGDTGRLILVDLNKESHRAFADLGLDQIASLQGRAAGTLQEEFPPDRQFEWLTGSDLTSPDRSFDALDRAVLMLECHEHLCQLDSRNEEKFREVKQFLREDIARHKHPNSK